MYRILLPILLIGCAHKGILPPATVQIPDPEILPPRMAYWDLIPEVVNCRGSSLKDQQIIDAYAYLSIEVEPRSEKGCKCEIIPAEVRFVSPKCFPDMADNHGMTRISFTPATEIIIGVAVGIETEDTMDLAHEAGHTLGWMHSSYPGHLMFPQYIPSDHLILGMK